MLLNYRRKFVTVLFFIVIIAGMFVFVSAHAQNEAKRLPAAKLPRIVDIGADKCIPCIRMAPELEKLRKEYAEVLEVEFVDVWKKPQAAEPYKVRGIPTQIFYDASGKEIHRHFGYISKDHILETFRKFGVDVDKKTEQQKK